MNYKDEGGELQNKQGPQRRKDVQEHARIHHLQPDQALQ